MDCLITSGIARGCKDNMGGIQWAVGFNYANGQGIASVNSGITKDSEPIAAGIVTSITMESGKTGYKFVPQKNTSSWTDAPTSEKATGVSFFTPTLNLSFAKYEAAKRNQLLLLTRSETVWIVKDRNNKFWLLGFHNGLDIVTGNGAQSGVNAGDMNGMVVSLAGEERVPAYEIFKTDVATTEALVEALVSGDSGSGFGL